MLWQPGPTCLPLVRDLRCCAARNPGPGEGCADAQVQAGPSGGAPHGGFTCSAGGVAVRVRFLCFCARYHIHSFHSILSMNSINLCFHLCSYSTAGRPQVHDEGAVPAGAEDGAEEGVPAGSREFHAGKLRGNCSAMQGNCSAMQGNCASMQGNCAFMQGNCASMQGNLASMQGSCASMWENCAYMRGNLASVLVNLAALQGDFAALH